MPPERDDETEMKMRREIQRREEQAKVIKEERLRRGTFDHKHQPDRKPKPK
jgi:hypothetical protein